MMLLGREPADHQGEKTAMINTASRLVIATAQSARELVSEQGQAEGVSGEEVAF
jgi:hypothetical protein